LTERIPFDRERFRWTGVAELVYKTDSCGARGMGFKAIRRHLLATGEAIDAEYDLRYFELEPGGYSSLEKHRHTHFVVALRGTGRALVGDRVFDLRPYDALHVPPLTPHRWINESGGPFGFLCPVDHQRDRPQPLDEQEWEALRANPVTAPYLF
jgi:quercetin dioxygenase-like cupin family protein